MGHKCSPDFAQEDMGNIFCIHLDNLKSNLVKEGKMEKSNCFGMQFHPERSGKIGLKLLENFLRIAIKLQGKPRLD
jgi:anthranilate/para-aminobenzoate synthase component II